MCSTAKVAVSAAVLISVSRSGGARPKVPSGNCEEMLGVALHAAGGNFIRFSARGRQPADRMRINECAVAFLFFAESATPSARAYLLCAEEVGWREGGSCSEFVKIASFALVKSRLSLSLVC